MTKYRVRLESGRVIGPFDKNQLFDLRAKGHIKGVEEAQIFPMGNWEPIQALDIYAELMDEDKTIIQSPPPIEETFIIDLTQLRNQKNEKEIEALGQGNLATIEELTETKRITPSEAKISLTKPEKGISDFSDATISLPDIDDDLLKQIHSHESTLINPVAQEELYRMRKQQKVEEQEIPLELLEMEIPEEPYNLEEQSELVDLSLDNSNEEELKENIPVPFDGSTQMFKLDNFELLETARKNELTIDEELKAIRKKEVREANEESEEDEEEVELNEPVKNKKKRNKLLIYSLGALALIYALLFPDDKIKKAQFKHLDPKIVFPLPFDVADTNKSTAAYNRGLEFFNQGTYPSIIKSGLSFKESYENNLDNTAALNFLVRAYAEQLQHSRSKQADAQILFALIQSKRPFLIQDSNGVIGINLFYMAINKVDAGIDVVQKYLKIKPKEVTQDLFAVYLQSLIRKGSIDLAKQFFLALDKAPTKTRYAYKALIEYLILNQQNDKAMVYADEALSQNPLDISFMLTKAELLINSELFKEAVPFLKKAETQSLDYNIKNRAKFLELKGMIYAFNKQTKEATAFFTKSLQLEDSISLRMNLAKLENVDGASAETDKLINESKAIKFLIQAKDFYEKNNFELAMSFAAKATDAFPGHIPSEVFLSKVQLRLGLTEQGLKTLETLATKYPEDKSINLALIQAYIDTYKFYDARNRIQNISTSDYRDSAEYASVNARLNLKMGDTLQAMSWLKNSIRNNPLNDEDLFILAEILLKKSNFDAARTMLNKCMELDPVNPDYRIAYARLIYETQDDMAAIGYLLGILKDFEENPKIMSEIAIFYYRAGKIKDFQDYKEKLEKNHASDKSLYQFLIKAALMDEKHNEIPQLVEKLLTVEPGDLEQMMTAGRVLFESGKLVEAAKWFKRIEEKLPSYPKVLYYQAKIDYLAGDHTSALKKLERNIKENGENDADEVLMAQIFVAKEQFVEAENLFKKAQKLNPRSYDAIVGLADLSTKRNNHDLALDLYKRALKLRSDEPVIHRKMGDVYRQLGQGVLAIESYKMYLEMDPESSHRKNLESYIQLMQ